MNDKNTDKNNDVKVERKEDLIEKENSEKIEKSTEDIRLEKWEKITNEIEHTADALNYPIDGGIKNSVIALNVFGINTAQSCEGHHDERGAGAPWVDIEAPNEPEERYNGQKKILARVAKDNGIKIEDLDNKEEYREIMLEAWEECADNGETEETVAWQEENRRLRIIIEGTLDDFYTDRSVPEDIKIRLKSGGWGCFRMISGTKEDYDRESKDANGETGLKERLEIYRKEMDDFSKFLKSKFFEEGENYIETKRRIAQKKIDEEKLEKVRSEINTKKFVNWNDFWEAEGLKSPAREDVFPDGGDARMSDEEIVETLNEYFEKSGSSLFNMTGIDSEEFPEIIDRDIRDLCARLNELPFIKTKEGCGGHESYYSTGEINDRGYSEPYLTFYISMEHPSARSFVRKLGKELDVFLKSGISGTENITFNFFDEPTRTDGVRLATFRMRLVPTEKWCKENDKDYIERPEDLGPYYQWCEEKKYEYSQNEDSDSWKKWEEAKRIYKIQKERFEKEYADYFRSEEAKKIRDEFFGAFEKASL